MKVKIAVSALIPFAAILVLHSTRARAAADQVGLGRRVYAKSRRRAARPLYSTACASCHGAELTGGEMAPPLAGGEFMLGLGRPDGRRSVRAHPDLDAAERAGLA